MDPILNSALLREAERQLGGYHMDYPPPLHRPEAEQPPRKYPKAYIDDDAICVPCRRALRDGEVQRIGRPQWVNDGFPNCENLSKPVLYCSLCRHIIRTREIAQQLRAREDSGVASQPLGLDAITNMSQVTLLHEQRYDPRHFKANRPVQLSVEADKTVRSIRYGSADLAWLASRFQECEAQHGSRCGSSDFDWFEDDARPLLLVDVSQSCLVKASLAARFFTLSYVWGGPQQFATTTGNLNSLLQPGALDSQPISKTIRDSMTVLRGLNERYLWVDVLSIIQDDAKIKQDEINRMATIYSKSFATIIALSGKSANSGLSGVQPTGRHADAVSIAPGLRITERTPLERALSDDTSEDQMFVYNTRAWTFQERLLSKRALIFLPEQLYFQCREIMVSEDRFQDKTNYDRSAVYSLNRAKEHLLTRDKATEQFPPQDEFLAERARLQRSAISESEFSIYDELVVLYTAKRITDPADVLNAFTGIMVSLKKLFSWNFVAGLPVGAKSFLDLAILWTPVDILSRRRLEGTDFPSWSWAGWIGKVHHNDIFRPCYASAQGPSMALCEIFEPAITISVHEETLRFRACGVGLNDVSLSAPDSKLHNPFYNCLVTSEVLFMFDKTKRRCGILYGLNANTLAALKRNALKLVLLSRWYRNSSMGRIRPIIVFIDENFRWSGEVREEGLFDDALAQKPWTILNVMLVHRVTGGYERVAVGQIHRDAFIKPDWIDVVLL